MEKENFNIKRLLNNNKLTQSQVIKFGTRFQEWLKEIAKKYGYELI